MLYPDWSSPEEVFYRRGPNLAYEEIYTATKTGYYQIDCGALRSRVWIYLNRICISDPSSVVSSWHDCDDNFVLAKKGDQFLLRTQYIAYTGDGQGRDIEVHIYYLPFKR